MKRESDRKCVNHARVHASAQSFDRCEAPHMFRYEHVNSTRKFTIVAEIVSLLKKIYKRDAPFRAVFKVKTLAVLFSPYPREVKHIPRNLNLPPFWRLLVSTLNNNARKPYNLGG